MDVKDRYAEVSSPLCNFNFEDTHIPDVSLIDWIRVSTSLTEAAYMTIKT